MSSSSKHVTPPFVYDNYRGGKTQTVESKSLPSPDPGSIAGRQSSYVQAGKQIAKSKLGNEFLHKSRAETEANHSKEATSMGEGSYGPPMRLDISRDQIKLLLPEPQGMSAAMEIYLMQQPGEEPWSSVVYHENGRNIN